MICSVHTRSNTGRVIDYTEEEKGMKTTILGMSGLTGVAASAFGTWQLGGDGLR